MNSNSSEQDTTVQKEVTANRVVAELMTGKHTIEDMKVLGKPIFTDLIMHLHKNRDKSQLMLLSLEALAEHAALLSLLNKNLVEATKLLESHNIPFQSMVNTDES